MSAVICLDCAFALQTLAQQFTRATNRFGLLPSALFRRFFVEFTPLHFAKRAFALHLLFQRAKRLFDIIVTDRDLYQGKFSLRSCLWRSAPIDKCRKVVAERWRYQIFQGLSILKPDGLGMAALFAGKCCDNCDKSADFRRLEQP